jgi:pimeloyl-ACP methyl ester carboxylesterase
MAKIKVNEIEIAYNVQGSGEPLILICGYTGVKESWVYQVDALARHFQVVTFDNRGVGETTVPMESFTIADMAADTAGLIDALGIAPAHAFGVSMGGLIAQTLALDFSDRIRKVVLGCTSHGGRHAVQPGPDVMAALAKAGDPTITPEESVRLNLPIVFSERFLQEQPQKVEDYIKTGLKYRPTPEGAAGQMKALSFFNVKKRLGEIRCPVLVIAGTEDKMMPPENARLLADGIPGAEIYMVEGAGHAFNVERPDEVNSVLIKFFKK